MERNVSTWLRDNTLNWKKLLKVQVILIKTLIHSYKLHQMNKVLQHHQYDIFTAP